MFDQIGYRHLEGVEKMDRTNLDEVLCRRRFIVIAILLLGSLLIHSFFVLDGLGEADAARLVIDAAKWHKTETFTYDISNYRPRTSPLYILFIRALLDADVALRDIPVYLNWTNCLIGAAVTVVLFVVWSLWVGHRAALVGTIFLFMTPSFWIANLYGFPHLPSILFFWISLYFFQNALERRGGLKLLWAVGCAVASFMSLGLKIDAILAYPALLGVVGYREQSLRFWRYSREDLVMAVLIPVLALLGVTTLTNCIGTTTHSFLGFAGNWSARFPWTLQKVVSWEFFVVPFTTYGGIMMILVLVSAIRLIYDRRRRWLLAIIIPLSLPLTLFWTFRFLDSARHWLLPASGLVFLPAVWLTDQIRPLRWFLPVALSLLATNYYFAPPFYSTRTPSPRLFDSHPLVKQEIHELHAEGRAFLDIDAPKRFVVARWRKPYVIYELLAGVQDYQWISAGSLLQEDPKRYIWEVVGADGKIFHVGEYYRDPEDSSVPLQSGWLYWNPKIGLFQPGKVRPDK
jgi:hypothetical protein